MGRVTYSSGETPNVAIIGAGYSGVLAGIRLKVEFGLNTFTIYDDHDNVGGSWLANDHPGRCSDSNSHLLAYSFELNPYWSHNYVEQDEILEYLQRAANKYSLFPYFKFNCEIKSLVWSNVNNKWKVNVYQKDTKRFDELNYDIVICCTGSFRDPIIPNEYKAFKGPIIHTGAWDPDVSLENKTVGVVGSGASAVQLVPAIVQKVKTLHCYQRNPSWVLPQLQFKFPKGLRWFFDKCWLLLLLFRWLVFWSNELHYPMNIHNSWLSRVARYFGERNLNKHTNKNYRLRWDLLPKYSIGCKRIIYSNDYYKAMASGHVSLHTDDIIQVKDWNIVTSSDRSEKLDILILATGFTVQEFFGPMTITDKQSQDVLTNWKNSPVRIRSYYGITTSATPNLFFILGPNTGVVHTATGFMLECQMNFIIQLMREMMERDANVIEVKETAEDEYLEYLEKELRKTVWKREKCGSWFTNSSGAVTTLWPSSCLVYWLKTRRADFSKFRMYQSRYQSFFTK